MRRGFAAEVRCGERLLEAVPALLAGRDVPASLLHGDLWCGNWLASAGGEPVLIDPAVYYGDREADLAMTALFGGFGAAFYRAYEAAARARPAGRYAQTCTTSTTCSTTRTSSVAATPRRRGP